MSTQFGGTHFTVSLGWCLSNDCLLLVNIDLLLFLLEVDRMVELLERPLSRNLHLRMLADAGPQA